MPSFSHIYLQYRLMMCLGLSVLTGGVQATESSTSTTNERFGPPVRSSSVSSTLGLGQIDVQQGGYFCYQYPENTQLWRAQATRAERLSVTNTSTHQKIKLLWPAEQHLLTWPIELLPIQDGTNYLIKRQERADIIVLYQMPENLDNMAAQKKWLEQHHCRIDWPQASTHE